MLRFLLGELGAVNAALGALRRGIFAFINIAANRANPLFHNQDPPNIIIFIGLIGSSCLDGLPLGTDCDYIRIFAYSQLLLQLQKRGRISASFFMKFSRPVRPFSAGGQSPHGKKRGAAAPKRAQ
jgi:hypothetical protein